MTVGSELECSSQQEPQFDCRPWQPAVCPGSGVSEEQSWKQPQRPSLRFPWELMGHKETQLGTRVRVHLQGSLLQAVNVGSGVRQFRWKLLPPYLAEGCLPSLSLLIRNMGVTGLVGLWGALWEPGPQPGNL